MTDDEFYNRVLPTFNRLNAGVGASVVVLIGFLAAVWATPELVEATLRALFRLGLALFAFAFITTLENAFPALIARRGRQRNFRETIRAYNVMVLTYWIWAMSGFYFDVTELNATRLEAPTA